MTADDAGKPKKKPRNPKRWLEKRLKEAGSAASSQLASTFHRKGGAAAGGEGEEAAGRPAVSSSISSRAVWLGEPPIEACKEWRSLHALEAAVEAHSAQVRSATAKKRHFNGTASSVLLCNPAHVRAV